MKEPFIIFQFADRRSAYQAYDMLEELGYRPEIELEGEHPQVSIRVDGNDLVSALEIAQAYGGTYVEQPKMSPNHSEHEMIQKECHLDDDHQTNLDQFSADVRI